jgi:hypothetical protein
VVRRELICSVAEEHKIMRREGRLVAGQGFAIPVLCFII